MNVYGNEKLLELRNKKKIVSFLHSKLKALIYAMDTMLQHTNSQYFGIDGKDI